MPRYQPGTRKRAALHEKLRRELAARRAAIRFKPVEKDKSHADQRKH